MPNYVRLPKKWAGPAEPFRFFRLSSSKIKASKQNSWPGASLWLKKKWVLWGNLKKKMSETWFTSDTHYSHFNIIEYTKRPFSSLEEMNETMIENFNRVVRQVDTVYHLGDFALGQWHLAKPIFDRLNGAKKILIKGNHDQSKKKMLELGFAEVHDSLEWNGWLLRHHPMQTHRNMLCGHVHNNWLRIDNVRNVGVDVWNFTPCSIEQLAAAPENVREYDCRYCHKTCHKLADNSSHRGGKCIATDAG